MEYNLTHDVTVSGGLIGAVGEQVCLCFSSLVLQFTAAAAKFQAGKLSNVPIQWRSKDTPNVHYFWRICVHFSILECFAFYCCLLFKTEHCHLLETLKLYAF